MKWWMLDESEGSPGGVAGAAPNRTPGGIPVLAETGGNGGAAAAGRLAMLSHDEVQGAIEGVKLRIELARLRMLRGFEELLCLEGLHGVEHLPHQIETVRKVLRHFRGRVLLADEVGLGKTIEASLLLREYLLRGLVKRVLILMPPPLTAQWRGELAGKRVRRVRGAHIMTA